MECPDTCECPGCDRTEGGDCSCVDCSCDDGIEGIIRKESNIVTILHEIQSKHSYLPKERLKELSEKLDTPLSHIYRLATFYKAFSLEPKGKHHIKVCKGTACHVREARKVVDRLETTLGIKSGETTKDHRFSLETVNCLGVCALGPVVVVNGEYFGQMDPAKVDKLIREYCER